MVFANFATIKKLLSKHLIARIILVLDVTFVPNLMFLGLLSAEISFGEKNHPATQLISPSVNFTLRTEKLLV